MLARSFIGAEPSGQFVVSGAPRTGGRHDRASRMPAKSHALAALLAAWLAGSAASDAAAAEPSSVLTYHALPDRSGSFVVPSLSWQRARSLQLDQGFHAQFPGHVYAQPLYWHAAGSPSGMLAVATEENMVYALDAKTGREIWSRSLGQPVSRSALSCGDIDPLGITGTPVIDEQSQAIYLDAATVDPDGIHHRIFALSLADGSSRPGWPVDVAAALERRQQSFNVRDQNQRGALTILNGAVYVPFGGHFGDCGQYRGWVVGVPLNDPSTLMSWNTRGRGGGIWAPGGISSDGRDLYVATGNTLSASRWSDGEAVFRLAPDLRRSDRPQDFFALKDWRELDQQDADLGGTNPLPVDVPAGDRSQALLLALGKDRHAYLLDRNNLGGMGGGLVTKLVAARPIRTAPAVYPAADGVFVAFQGQGTDCPTRRLDNDLIVLKIRSGAPPGMTTAWCGAFRGTGSPIVTTTDGRANAIVWVVGAEGDNRLHGFKGDTGEPLFDGNGIDMAGLHRFQTLLATADRLYVAADSRIYAFAF